MCDYLKYERKFDKNNFDLEHNKITIGEYDERFRAIVDEIRADERTKNGKEQTLSDIHFQMEKPLSDKEIKSLQNAFGEIYERGKSDGYKKAENDYHTQTEKDRQSSYDCGYEKGKSDERRKFAEWLEKEDLLTLWHGDDDNETLSAEKVLEMYEKEQKNG